MSSAPYIRSTCTRSVETFSGITQTSRYPRSFATMAREIPVLPLVGSRMVSPGRSRPAASAPRTMCRAARSLTDPVGLRSSSLAQRRTSGDGDSRGSPTSGVLPQASSRLSNRAIASAGAGECRGRREGERATGDGGQDGDRVAVLELGVQRAEEAHVLVVDVDVDEPVQPALVGDQPGTQPAVPAVQVGEQVGERVSAALDGLRAAGVRAQDGGDTNLDSHGRDSL